MNRKKKLVTTSLLLFALSLLTVNRFGVSAVPVSPYIMILPEATLDENLTPGMYYEVSIVTDYAGSDVWGGYFGLTFNPTVLEGISVTNGDLITQDKNPPAYFVWEPGTFDNTAGILSLSAAYYDYVGPGYDTTYGPGTLANVTFRVKGYGFSHITFDLTTQTDTRLMGATGSSTYNIIRGYDQPDRIGNGYFSNKLLGDVNGDRTVNGADLNPLKLAYGSVPGRPEWELQCDFDWNQKVDVRDLYTLGNNYGRSV